MHDNSINKYVDGYFFLYWSSKSNISCSEDGTFISEIKRQHQHASVNYVPILRFQDYRRNSPSVNRKPAAGNKIWRLFTEMSNANRFFRFLIRPTFRPLTVTSVVFWVIQNRTVQWLYSHLPYKGYKCALTPPFVTTYRANLHLSIDVHPRCSPSASGTYLWFVPRWPLLILNHEANFI
jgi:hypothetical protein